MSFVGLYTSSYIVEQIQEGTSEAVAQEADNSRACHAINEGPNELMNRCS